MLTFWLHRCRDPQEDRVRWTAELVAFTALARVLAFLGTRVQLFERDPKGVRP
ncbi:MAG: hypothetical protein HY303_10190 [Candidatus Wallbacteria bacterium]|nr:hypothetical protein [Candidatus Wallbacteria bacterium]